ncbi:hypothetical protein MUO14_15495 [Halobacillus shinanisalinarum]|uniref:Uncharacterized protein n=1 Tax=Halobacillus shinanisalinarum TaxID=2932258 RepID=A0ABY4GVD0_9BACI|nr:hypothetical protein [Halobacillus shinanisalinarum]UOQ91911.1 hypothetical protein MUO14_15495 [Halobacillus shinanisalinarum]
MYMLQEADKIQLPDQHTILYYPYVLSEWSVEYKPLPFMKNRNEKMRVISNMFYKDTGLFAWSMEKLKALPNNDQAIFLPEQYEDKDRHHTTVDFLRNLYLHKRKVWSNPLLDCLNTYSLYVPYAIFPEYSKKQRGYQILEISSGHRADLKKHKDIYHYLQTREVIE